MLLGRVSSSVKRLNLENKISPPFVLGGERFCAVARVFLPSRFAFCRGLFLASRGRATHILGDEGDEVIAEGSVILAGLGLCLMEEILRATECCVFGHFSSVLIVVSSKARFTGMI